MNARRPGSRSRMTRRPVRRSARAARAFTLLETVLALTLSSLVLVSAFAVMLALVRIYKSFKSLKDLSQRALGLMSELDALRAQA